MIAISKYNYKQDGALVIKSSELFQAIKFLFYTLGIIYIINRSIVYRLFFDINTYND
jgi:hypothetical protein